MSTTPGENNIAKSLAAGLGALVWWDLHETKVSAAHLRALLDAESYDDVDVPDLTLAKEQASALRRASREWTRGRGNADRYRAEVVSEDARGLAVGILRRDQVSADEVRWVQVELLTFAFGAGGGWWTSQPSEVAAEYVAIADDMRRFLDHKFLREDFILPELRRMRVVALRRQGGMYFCAGQYLPDLERMRRVIQGIGASRIRIIHAADSADTVDSVAAGVRDDTADALTELRDRIAEWKASARKVRKDAQASVLGEFAALQDRADLYEAALNVKLTDLQDAIRSAKDEALVVLAAMSGQAPLPLGAK